MTGEPPCDLFTAELALDRIEAELASELPPHIRAFARAYADGTPTPPAPEVARRDATLTAAIRALSHPLLEDRATTLLRLLAPIAIEEEPDVIAARDCKRTWANYDALRDARDAAAHARFGRGFLELVHALHGVSNSPIALTTAWPEPIPGWLAPDHSHAVGSTSVEGTWEQLAAVQGVRGVCRIVESTSRPRAFTVEPGHEVIVVVGALDSPAARFAAMHELGHAVAALVPSPSIDRPLPRVVDEAAAAYVARSIEDARHPWFSPLAEAARHRRHALAVALDAIERGGGERRTERPPWALWHDPGAQAAYVAAEVIAERWWQELGPSPSPGALATAIRSAATAIARP